MEGVKFARCYLPHRFEIVKLAISINIIVFCCKKVFNLQYKSFLKTRFHTDWLTLKCDLLFLCENWKKGVKKKKKTLSTSQFYLVEDAFIH